MKRYILSALSCVAALWPGLALAQSLTTHGNFRHMMHTGETAGTVALDTFDVPGAWGVGVVSGLRGEVLLRDGQVLVSRGSDPEARLSAPDMGEQAVLLAYGAVQGWQKMVLPHDMDPAGLTHFIEMQASALGLDANAGFPIRLAGRFPDLVWHVVTGEAPAHGAGHSNHRAGMNIYDESGAAGEIIGVYTGAALEGMASHPGERLHLHFLDKDVARSGHVDQITLPAGTTVFLPLVADDMAAAGGTHDMTHGASPTVREGGQSAFTAIQEITSLLMADPETDWARVDIEKLRQHLIDMDNVTLRATVVPQEVDGGARFVVTSEDPAVTASIRAMVPAHAATMDGVEGWTLRAVNTAGGASLTVTGPDTTRIRALGFIGIMTVGMHHQAHHLALASGQNPHEH